MNLKCRLLGHKYIAANPEQKGETTLYRCACQRIGCGAPALLTVWRTPARNGILYEPSKTWNGVGPIPEWWMKIVVS